MITMTKDHGLRFRSWWARFASTAAICWLAVGALRYAPWREHYGVWLWMVAVVLIDWAAYEKECT